MYIFFKNTGFHKRTGRKVLMCKSLYIAYEDKYPGFVCLPQCTPLVNILFRQLSLGIEIAVDLLIKSEHL